jgi:hypothetical protein
MAPKGTQVATGPQGLVPSFLAAQRQPNAPHTPGTRGLSCGTAGPGALGAYICLYTGQLFTGFIPVLYQFYTEIPRKQKN